MSRLSVNLPTLFLGRLRPPKRLTSTLCAYFCQCPSWIRGRRNQSMWRDWVLNLGPLVLESDAGWGLRSYTYWPHGGGDGGGGGWAEVYWLRVVVIRVEGAQFSPWIGVKKVKVKVSHSLIAVGPVGVRDTLYLGHSWWKAEPIPRLSLPYPSLIRKRYPFSAGLTERVFQSLHGAAEPRTHAIWRLSAP